MKTSLEFGLFFDQLDSKVRQGEAQSALIELKKLNSIPRPYLARMARLGFRAGDPRFTIKTLSDIVKSHTPSTPNCSTEELAVYALALMEIGVYGEAFQILSALRAEDFPETDFYYAMTLFKQWNYQEAIPYLQRYIASSKISPYQNLVGKVNLAAALIVERDLNVARNLLDEILLEAEKENNLLLLGNALELLSQLSIHERNFFEARSHLARAKSVLEKSKGVYSLFVDKWSTIADLLEFGPQPAYREKLAAVRSQALKLGHWSSVRETDLYLAIVTSDLELFKLVYYGTPFPAYRRRMQKLFGLPPDSLTLDYDWTPLGAPISKKSTLDVELGIAVKTGARLKKDHVTHRLLKALCSDFYAPFRSEELFSLIFNGEKFNLESSSSRVYNAVSALKKWIDENKLPAAIVNDESGYRFKLNRPYHLLVSLKSQLNKIS